MMEETDILPAAVYYDVACIMSSLLLPVAGIRLFWAGGFYVFMSLTLACAASLAFRCDRLCTYAIMRRVDKGHPTLYFIDLAFAIHAFVGCSAALLPFKAPVFFGGLGIAACILGAAVVSNSMATEILLLHFSGHLVLMGTLLFL